MTTEVAVMNRTAIALAADSAVTIGGDKVYNTVNKLFTLSKTEPIGIMVFGSASIMNVPWETVIKTYRKHIGSKKFPTIESCGKDFLEFLSKDGGIFSDKTRERFITQTVSNLCAAITQEVINDQRLEGASDKEVLETAAQIGSEIIYREYGQIEQQCDTAATSKGIRKMLETYGELFNHLAASELENIYPLLEIDTKELLQKALAMYFFSEYLSLIHI